MLRLAILFVAFLVAVVFPASVFGAHNYWNVKHGIIHDKPDVPYEAGDDNPDVAGNWGIRVERSNCEAKFFLRVRSNLQLQQISPSEGCAITDYTICYDANDYDASFTRNTDTTTGTADVWVNVRVDWYISPSSC